MTTPPAAKRRRCSPPPELNDDIIGEILLRLPPDDPALLVRCSLVCKPWRRILSSDPVFLRRCPEFHRRTPRPLLGFLFNQLGDDPDVACFAPTSSLRRLPHPHHPDCTMLSRDAEAAAEHELVVWDPMTGRRWGLDFPGFLEDFNWSASVLCSDDGCDHRHCHGAPFLVAVASTGRYCNTSATVYSSETGDAIALEREHPDPDDAIKVGSPASRWGTRSHTLAVFDSPVAGRGWPDNGLLMTAEGGGGLGFALARRSMLHLWSREATGAGDGAMAWSPLRGINLEPLLTVLIRRPPDHHTVTPNLIGGEVFTIEVRSRRGKKVYKREDIHTDFLYTSFYTPRGGERASGCCRGRESRAMRLQASEVVLHKGDGDWKPAASLHVSLLHRHRCNIWDEAVRAPRRQPPIPSTQVKPPTSLRKRSTTQLVSPPPPPSLEMDERSPLADKSKSPAFPGSRT
uniref:F-box domain-containing protein n=1 Tax=Oryza punctata TaxID=4537 RepID=A0A0E0MGM6_ORYPU